MTRAPAAHSLYYQVGVFGLVRSRGKYLTTQPLNPLLPGAAQLPGLLLSTASGAGLAELGLRRSLLSQVGLAVGSLSLVGSFAVRLPEGDSRLSLIFGSDYVSGILAPTGEVRQADWHEPVHLRSLGAPEWLFAAIREFEAVAGTVPEEGAERSRKPGLLGLLGRKSEPDQG